MTNLKLEGNHVGFRQWELFDNPQIRPAPYSINERNFEWPPGIIEATCRPRSLALDCLRDPCKEIPGADCSCGFYSYIRPYITYAVDPLTMTGVVVINGRTALHPSKETDRYLNPYEKKPNIIRSQYAQIVAVGPTDGYFASRSIKEKYKMLASNYEIDLVDPDFPDELEGELYKVASQYGDLIPDEMCKKVEKRNPSVGKVDIYSGGPSQWNTQGHILPPSPPGGQHYHQNHFQASYDPLSPKQLKKAMKDIMNYKRLKK